jgi:hypothetical protein
MCKCFFLAKAIFVMFYKVLHARISQIGSQEMRNIVHTRQRVYTSRKLDEEFRTYSTMGLEIIPLQLFEEFSLYVPVDLQKAFDSLQDAERSNAVFSYYLAIASIYSSKIAGKEVDIDNYLYHKEVNSKAVKGSFLILDRLYEAYLFANNNKLCKRNLEWAYQLMSGYSQCSSRSDDMRLWSPNGKLEYEAAPFELLNEELDKFFHDLDLLLEAELDINQVFYFASILHLLLVKIHPWVDFNGRVARLLEKWFLAQKLGPKAWFIQSEKNYYLQQQTYYSSLRALGDCYDLLNYSKALPFLLMLPNSIY